MLPHRKSEDFWKEANEKDSATRPTDASQIHVVPTPRELIDTAHAINDERNGKSGSQERAKK